MKRYPEFFPFIVSIFFILCVVPSVSTALKTPLDSNSRLQVINGRLGSRLYLAQQMEGGSIEMGALGFDIMNNPVKAFSTRKHAKMYSHEVSLKTGPDQPAYHLLPSASERLLSNQNLELSLTRTCITGEHNEGLKLTHCVVSPLSWPKSLEDENHLKISIAPFFYHTLEVENTGETSRLVEISFRINAPFISRERLDGVIIIRLKEPRTNALSRRPPEMALACAEADTRATTGKTSGFGFSVEVGPGAKEERTLVLAAYTAEPVIRDKMSDLDLTFYYTRFWDSVEKVIKFAAGNREFILNQTELADCTLGKSSMPEEKQWLAALCFHTYLANTWLVQTPSGEPRFYVWEGKFGYHSTVDVAHETEVMAYFMPWTLGLQLEQWSHHIKETAYGSYLVHDIGIDQETGYSFYESWFMSLLKLPPMPVEENSNFSLLLNWYLYLTGDGAFVKKLLPTAEKLLLANRGRDLDGNGIADVDTGTTYDVSDALHVAPNNVYLGVKEMAAYLAGADLCDRFGCGPDSAPIFRAEAKKILDALKMAEKEFGYLPTALDKNYDGWDQASVVLGDGLLYPALTGFSSPETDELTPILKKSFLHALERSRREHGVVMTESEGIIFYSKVMVMEPVSKYIYGEPTELWRPVYEWNSDNPQAYNDGAHSSTQPWIGYNYPRGVVIFWELLPPPGF